MKHIYDKIHGWFNYKDLYSNLVKELPNGSKFAEIGVWKGKSLSYFVIESINSNKQIDIYAIDTWLGSLEHQKGQPNYDPLVDIPDGLFNNFISNIKLIKDYINIIRENSIDASKKFPDNYFDAIFLDASHEYEDVLNDLIHWLPKMKQDNIQIYGHDYTWSDVKKAVDEFASDNKLNVIPISKSSWKIYKKDIIS